MYRKAFILFVCFFAVFSLSSCVDTNTEVVCDESEVKYDNECGNDYLKYSESDKGLIITGFSGLSISNLVIPSTINGIRVVSIDDAAFEEKQIETVTLPDTLISIGVHAFSYNLLTSLTIPNGVTTIKDSAFSFNDISYINIPDSVSHIGSGAFHHNEITNAVISKHVTYLGFEAFTYNPLVSYSVESENTHYKSIDGVLFTNDIKILLDYPKEKTEKDYVIPNGVEVIHDFAFVDCGINSIILPDSLIEIGYHSFSLNNLTSISLPEGLLVIKQGAFYKNHLVSITIPSTVNIIEPKVVILNYSTIPGPFDENNITEVIINGDISRFNDIWEDIGFPVELKPN